MDVKTNQTNQTNKQNPLIDTGQVTVNAFNILKNKQKSDKNFILGQNDTTLDRSPNNKVKVKAWTQDDDKTHTYFTSLSIDVNVEDFMGTAELKCAYDSDLMEYWEPIRQTVVIYGANRGDYKILFIGRVRELKQDGYELVITFQNYGWKFKQLVTQSYANDCVLNKDGYTIMKLMFEALKIDSYVISESAKNRLKEVGINSDGNLTLNGKELEEMPDLLERLKASDPSKLLTKDTLNNKLREGRLYNIKNINYTLKYEKPTPVMQKIASQGDYSAGSNVYQNAYSSPSAAGGGSGGISSKGSSSKGGGGGNCNPPNIATICKTCKNSSVQKAMQSIWKFNRDCVSDYSGAYNTIVNFARNSPATYSYQAAPCLRTMAKYTTRSDKKNAAQVILDAANNAATASGFNKRVSKTVNDAGRSINAALNKLAKGDVGGAVTQLGHDVWNWGAAAGHSIGLW